MKWSVLTLLVGLSLAGCDNDDNQQQAATSTGLTPVKFEKVEGVAAERLKLEIDQQTGHYVQQMTKRTGRTLEVEVAPVTLSPQGTPDMLVFLRGSQICTIDVCKLAIIHRPANQFIVTNIFGFTPPGQQVVLANEMGHELRDLLITQGTKATRYRYNVSLVDVESEPTGTYEPIRDEPNPLADGAR